MLRLKYKISKVYEKKRKPGCLLLIAVIIVVVVVVIVVVVVVVMLRMGQHCGCGSKLMSWQKELRANGNQP